ncbi:MAG: hypothetical protein Tsb0021_00220 [Chlamydiales bacterium]
MAIGQFSALLSELGQELRLPLVPDENDACVIRFPNGIKVQLEIDDADEFFVLLADIGSIPLGRYREDIFKEALQYNGTKEPRRGTFAFSSQTGTLIFFKQLTLNNLNGRKIHRALIPLMETAYMWHSAIANGEHPTIENLFQDSEESGSQGLFGLKP